jgi:hypothetical protein
LDKNVWTDERWSVRSVEIDPNIVPSVRGDFERPIMFPLLDFCIIEFVTNYSLQIGHDSGRMTSEATLCGMPDEVMAVPVYEGRYKTLSQCV